MCCSRLTALRPEQGDRSPRRELQASAEGFTEGHTAAQFSERRCSATFRAIPSTLERIDTAPPISRHLPAAATTYHLGVTRHLTATVSVRGIQLPMSDWQTIPRSRSEAAALTLFARSPTHSGSHRRCRSRALRPRAFRPQCGQFTLSVMDQVSRRVSTSVMMPVSACCRVLGQVKKSDGMVGSPFGQAGAQSVSRSPAPAWPLSVMGVVYA